MSWGKYGVQNISSTIRVDLKPSFRINTSFVFLFIVTAMLFSSPLVINDAFAINAVILKNPYANNLPTELKWQMVFISSASACSNYHYQMMETYYDVVIQYLKLYELETISYDPLCITEKKYLSDYENPSDLDLIILVYDDDLGEKELHSNQMGGVYTHSGTDRTQNHVIIICDCSNFDYSSPVWILSHEISHFILYYKNFEMSVIESLIHVNDAKYDQCLKESTTCKSSSIKMMAGPGNYEYSVMPIYQPAVGLQTENDVINGNAKYPISSEISKIITLWWATDIISDEQYSNAIGYLVDSNSISSNDDVKLILTDGPLNDVVTWEQMMEEITPTYWAHEPKSDDDSMAYLSKIPPNMIADDNQFLKKPNFGLPNWFKETASLWGQEMISDAEFSKNVEYLVKQGIIEPSASNVFEDLLDESNYKTASTVLPVSDTGQNNNKATSSELVDDFESKLVSVTTPSLNAEVSEKPSDVPAEIVIETIKEVPMNVEGINDLVEFVDSIPDIDNRVHAILETVVVASDEGNVDLTCSNLEYFFIILENLIESDDIDVSLGQSLIAEGELIKIDLCN